MTGRTENVEEESVSFIFIEEDIERISATSSTFENAVGSQSRNDGDVCLAIEYSVRQSQHIVSRPANTKAYHYHDIFQYFYVFAIFTMMSS